MELVKNYKRAGKYATGQRHGRSKLTDHEVELMREMHESGMAEKDLAEKFEISRSQVCKLVNFKQR